MSYYKDLRQYIETLEKNDRLFRIKKEINKDIELHPVVRWEFRGLPAESRKAFLFENIVDVKGTRYHTPVLIAYHAPCRAVYALAMDCLPEEISEKWRKAQVNPVKPVVVKSGPVHEEIHSGNSLLEHGGLEEFPVPVSTPGFENAPYLTAANWVSKDPDNGVYNIGNYRAMIKSQLRLGINCRWPQHLRQHREKARALGMPSFQAAAVIGTTPNIGLVGATKLPFDISEYDVAGGIAGEPVNLVQCKTVDLLVPATAEIVLEGTISCDYLEREGPFGEYAGYMGPATTSLYFDITAITHRKDPIFSAFISQFPPSESSLMASVNLESMFLKFLKHDLRLACVADVGFHNESSGRQLCVISLQKPEQPDVWKALNGAMALMTDFAKIVVAVDDDIDPRDADSIMWALCFRMQPDRDMRVTPGKRIAMDYSIAPYDKHSPPPVGSGLMINATRRWAYPPASLPRRDIMEKAKQIWDGLKLPPLIPKTPWFGSNLGDWSEEDSLEAELALRGQYYLTGEKIARDAVKG